MLSYSTGILSIVIAAKDRYGIGCPAYRWLVLARPDCEGCPERMVSSSPPVDPYVFSDTCCCCEGAVKERSPGVVRGCEGPTTG